MQLRLKKLKKIKKEEGSKEEVRRTDRKTDRLRHRQRDRQTRTNAISLFFSNRYIYHRHHQRERTECAARDTAFDCAVHIQHGRKGRCSIVTRRQENGYAETVCRHDFWLRFGHVQFYTAGLP